ncbi:MAG: hypothetical protein J7K83_00540 [Candidatus Aenigmarchaeota archaeon]|nr:hypothetical protein [Candidatus Aenigmarchaeota archaeon]
MSIKDFFSAFLNVIETTLKQPEKIFLDETATKLESIIYFTLLSLISFLMNFIVISSMNTISPFDILSLVSFDLSKILLTSSLALVIGIVFSVVIFIVESILIYISFKLSGVKSLSDIMFVISISMTPTLLFSWIPFIGPLIGIVWSSVLYLFGLRYKCGLTINGIVKGLLIASILHLILIVFIIFVSFRFVSGFVNSFSGTITGGLMDMNQNYVTENYTQNPLDYVIVSSYCNDTYVSVHLSNFGDQDIENLRLVLYDENNNMIAQKDVGSISSFEYKKQDFYVYDTHDRRFVIVITDNSGNKITHEVSCGEHG